MAIINVENAQIKTAAVEIKTLTISGKQVTLSVFKQITEEPLIDIGSMKLNGIPWGNINYFWGENKDCDNKKYFHVIWQKGNELRRSIINKDKWSMNIQLEHMTDFQSDRSAIIFLEDKEPRQEHSDYAKHSFTYNLAEIDRKLRDAKENLVKPPGFIDNYFIEEAKKNIDKFTPLKEETVIELKNIRERYFNSKAIIENNLKEFDKIIQSLSSLPHLFIAI